MQSLTEIKADSPSELRMKIMGIMPEVIKTFTDSTMEALETIQAEEYEDAKGAGAK